MDTETPTADPLPEPRLKRRTRRRMHVTVDVVIEMVNERGTVVSSKPAPFLAEQSAAELARDFHQPDAGSTVIQRTATGFVADHVSDEAGELIFVVLL